jgi:hypothetical protein
MPLNEADTTLYFGKPIYTYSLMQGIEDGFLAPFRVHRVVTGLDATGCASSNIPTTPPSTSAACSALPTSCNRHWLLRAFPQLVPGIPGVVKRISPFMKGRAKSAIQRAEPESPTRAMRFRTCSSISGRGFPSFGAKQRGVTRVVASSKNPHREIAENERLHEFAVFVAMRDG